MMQGDCYSQGIEILDSNGNAVLPQDVADVEVVIGNLKKTYASGQVKYGEDCWLFPLSQQESLALNPGPLRGQVRIKWLSGEVDGCPLELPALHESRSREVL